MKKGNYLFSGLILMFTLGGLMAKANPTRLLKSIDYPNYDSVPVPIINSTLSGKVVDEKTEKGLPGAVIKIKGTTHQVISDEAGNFAFKTGQKLPYTLVVSYVGYETLELIAEDAKITIRLKNKFVEQDEIVVVGYGVQSRKSLVGSITKINANEAKQIPVASVDAQLQGRAAGVQINGFSGTPGESIKALIRGTTSVNASNEPLYVIDGIFVNNNSLASINLGSKRTSPLADLNPSDIESIEVLKDASAIAIYGSRGSNGVILITTKRGQYNSGKPKINIDVSTGWQKADESRLWELTTGPEHATIVNEQWINSGIDNPSLNQNFTNRPFRPKNEIINDVSGRGNPEEQETIDRLGRVLRTGRIQNFDLAVTGGSDKVKYNFGAGYANQEGILKPARFERRSARLNFDAKLSPKVSFSSSNSVGRSFRQQVRGGAGQEAGHLLAALHHPTYMPLWVYLFVLLYMRILIC